MSEAGASGEGRGSKQGRVRQIKPPGPGDATSAGRGGVGASERRHGSVRCNCSDARPGGAVQSPPGRQWPAGRPNRPRLSPTGFDEYSGTVTSWEHGPVTSVC